MRTIRSRGISLRGEQQPVATTLLVLVLISTTLLAEVFSFQPLGSVRTESSKGSHSGCSSTQYRIQRLFLVGNDGKSPPNGMQVEDEEDDAQKQKNKDLLRVEKNSGLLRLAKLSLQDYEWRVGFFKNREADRKVEESLARMMGDEASYVRPMDASENNIGPLGLWEKESVEWLQQVIDEEGRRAKEIVRLGGILVRPMDASAGPGEIKELGPLGMIERRVVDFLESIRRSERERSKKKILRPKDMEASKRGPLGEAELRASEAIREILNSERVRMQESRRRDGIVRPIDIPGPLGELEMAVLEVVRAEEQRKQETKENNGAVLVRPMNARTKGPMGELEAQATEAVKRLTDEEKQRVRNIQRYLDENRPMQQNEKTLLGVIETIVVGIVRAPILLFQIFNRVKDLLDSETINDRDAQILRESNEKTKKK